MIRGGRTMKQMGLVASLALAVAVALLASLVVTSSQSVSAQGTRGQEGTAVSSFPKTANPPDALLMKGPIVLQKGRELTRCLASPLGTHVGLVKEVVKAIVVCLLVLAAWFTIVWVVRVL
jgi:hypothetical protein